MGKIVFVVLLILLANKRAVHGRERKYIQLPSQFLQPPPISRSFKVVPLLNKYQPVVKPHYEKLESQFSMNSVFPRIANWFWPSTKASDKVLQTSQYKPVWETFQNFSVENRHCNPCNSVPWIPIVGVGRSVPKEPVIPLHQPFPLPSPATVHQPSFASDSYYSSLSQIQTNLIPHHMFFNAPIPQLHQNVFDIPQIHQNIIDNPQVRQNLLEIPQIHQDSDLPEHQLNLEHAEQNQDGSTNCPNGVCFSSSGSDSVQESSLHNPRNAGFDSNDLNITAPSGPTWVQEPKKAPMSHYLLSVDYPLQIFQTPLLDVPYQLPDLHSSNVDLPRHVQNQVFSSTAAPQFTSPSAEASVEPVHKEIRNSMDDNKYSPSESQFSSMVAESNHLNDNFTDVPTTTETLMDYLTPPTLTFNDDWTQSENKYDNTPKKKKQIQIVVPYTMNKNHLKNSTESWTEKSSRFKDIWASFTETTTPLPIVSYLRSNNSVAKYAVPGKRQEYSDLIRLQKAIDTWTVEGYSNHKQKPNDYFFQKVVTSTLSPSKEIPKNYLDSGKSTYTQKSAQDLWINSPKMEEKMHRLTYEDLHKNKTSAKTWDKLSVSVSPITKEKVYIVTPLPLTSFNFSADGGIQNWP